MSGAEIEKRAVPAEGVVGTLYEPAGGGPHPGVLTLHGAGGRRGDRAAKRLAAEGFATLALTYVGDPEPLPEDLARVPLEYVEGAAAWVLGLEAVAGEQVGLFGVSRGAELALLVASRADWAGAVVSYAGSGVVYDTPGGEPAWVANGEPVAHITGVGEPEHTENGVLTRPVLERGLEAADEDALAAATVPVEAIDGPVLLVSGGADTVWPARRLSAVAADRRAAADRAVTHLTHDDVGHLISLPGADLGESIPGGGDPAATAAIAETAWERTRSAFARGLPGGG